MNPLTQALWLFEIEVWKLSFIRTSTRYSFSQCISKVPNRSEHTHDRMNHLKQCCCIQQQMTHDGIKSSATDLCLYPMKAWKLGTLPNKHELKSRQSFTTFREELPVVCYLVSWICCTTQQGRHECREQRQRRSRQALASWWHSDARVCFRSTRSSLYHCLNESTVTDLYYSNYCINMSYCNIGISGKFEWHSKG